MSIAGKVVIRRDTIGVCHFSIYGQEKSETLRPRPKSYLNKEPTGL